MGPSHGPAPTLGLPRHTFPIPRSSPVLSMAQLRRGLSAHMEQQGGDREARIRDWRGTVGTDRGGPGYSLVGELGGILDLLG